MADIDFDFSDLLGLAADLGSVDAKVIPNIRKALDVSSIKIKKDWADGAAKANPAHAKRYGKSIDYDLELGKDGEMSSEIGPNLAKSQGSFGLLEDAPGGVRAAPQGSARKAVKNNIEDFQKGILKATEGII